MINDVNRSRNWTFGEFFFLVMYMNVMRKYFRMISYLWPFETTSHRGIKTAEALTFNDDITFSSINWGICSNYSFK